MKALVFPDAEEVFRRARHRRRGMFTLAFNPDALPPAVRKALDARSAETGKPITEIVADAIKSLARKGGAKS